MAHQRWHISDGRLHVDVLEADDELDAFAQAVALAPELTEGSVEPSKPEPVYGAGGGDPDE
jgi:hypothetical protein